MYTSPFYLFTGIALRPSGRSRISPGTRLLYRDCGGVSTMVRYNRRKACAKKVGVLQRICKVGKVLVCAAAVAVVPTLRGQPFIMGCCPQAFLFGHPKRKRKRCPLLPIARAWRRTTSAAIPQSGPARVLQSPTGALIAARPHSSPAQGARPLGTPKRRSKKQKAKTCRSAARFLTLFTSSPIDPSGAKINSMVVEFKAPLCKGSCQRS